MPSFEKNSPAAVGLLSDDQIETLASAVAEKLSPQLHAIQDGINALAAPVQPASAPEVSPPVVDPTVAAQQA